MTPADIADALAVHSSPSRIQPLNGRVPRPFSSRVLPPLSTSEGMAHMVVAQEVDNSLSLTWMGLIREVGQQCGLEVMEEASEDEEGSSAESGPSWTWSQAREAWTHLATAVATPCTSEQQTNLQQGLNDFYQCSGVDLPDLLSSQQLPSALMQVGLACASTLSAASDLSDQENNTASSSSWTLPNMTEPCSQAIWGPHVLGDFMRKAVLSPQLMCTCSTMLSNHVDSCTTSDYQWVGDWIGKGLCLAEFACGVLDAVCESELVVLDSCLPALDTEELDCDGIMRACAPPLSDNVHQASILLTLPYPLLGMPLPDTCQQVSTMAALVAGEQLVDRYDRYRQACLAPWASWSLPYDVRNPTVNPDGSPAASPAKNELPQVGLIGFLIGVFSPWIIYGAIYLVCSWYRSAPKRPPATPYSSVQREEPEIELS